MPHIAGTAASLPGQRLHAGRDAAAPVLHHVLAVWLTSWTFWPVQGALTSLRLLALQPVCCTTPLKPDIAFLERMQLWTSAYAPEMKVANENVVVAAFCARAQHLLPACQRTCKIPGVPR